MTLGDGESPDETSHQRAAGVRAYALFALGAVEHELSFSAYDMQRNLYGTETYLDYDPFTWAVTGATLRTFDVDYAGRRAALAWKAAANLGPRAAGLWRRSRRAKAMRRRAIPATGRSIWAPLRRWPGCLPNMRRRFGEGLDVVASLRHDEHSRFGGQNTARLAASWQLADDLILRGAVGTGFRAPSGYELFGPYGFAGLQPEQSRSFDLGVEKHLGGDAFLRATLFRIDTDNLIDFSDMGTPFDYIDDRYAQVPGRTRRQGLELEAAVPLGARVDATASLYLHRCHHPAAQLWQHLERGLRAPPTGAEHCGQAFGQPAA